MHHNLEYPVVSSVLNQSKAQKYLSSLNAMQKNRVNGPISGYYKPHFKTIVMK